MDNERRDLPPLKTFWNYLSAGLRRAHAARPVSFYLLLSIPVVLLLGLQLLDSRGEPKRFVFYLALFFVFFYAVTVRALQDFFDIAKRHFIEHEKVYRATLGDKDFASELGQRVSVYSGGMDKAGLAVLDNSGIKSGFQDGPKSPSHGAQNGRGVQ